MSTRFMRRVSGAKFTSNKFKATRRLRSNAYCRVDTPGRRSAGPNALGRKPVNLQAPVANHVCLIAPRRGDLAKNAAPVSFGHRGHFAVKQYGLVLEQIVVG